MAVTVKLTDLTHLAFYNDILTNIRVSSKECENKKPETVCIVFDKLQDHFNSIIFSALSNHREVTILSSNEIDSFIAKNAYSDKNIGKVIILPDPTGLQIEEWRSKMKDKCYSFIFVQLKNSEHNELIVPFSNKQWRKHEPRREEDF